MFFNICEKSAGTVNVAMILWTCNLVGLHKNETADSAQPRNEEKRQVSPDPFPRHRVGSGRGSLTPFFCLYFPCLFFFSSPPPLIWYLQEWFVLQSWSWVGAHVLPTESSIQVRKLIMHAFCRNHWLEGYSLIFMYRTLPVFQCSMLKPGRLETSYDYEMMKGSLPWQLDLVRTYLPTSWLDALVSIHPEED